MIEQKHIGNRATTIEELESILNKFSDKAARERGLTFEPTANDILISPYPKCGTTLLQQIAHGLRTRGNMDFDEITAVTPWLEIASDIGWDLEAPQVAEPRIYKSHTSWHEIPKGGRYIISFRHSHDAMVSSYRFWEGWLFEPNTISLGELTRWHCPRDKADKQGYWHHLSSWWEQRHNESILLLCYEDMVADLPSTVRKIAHFMDITLDDELLDVVTRQSSREFMLARSHQFDAHHLVQVGGKRAGLPPAIDTNKVTSGTPNNAHYQLSSALKQMLDDVWHEQIASRFGLDTYEDLCQSLRELHQSNDNRDGG